MLQQILPQTPDPMLLLEMTHHADPRVVADAATSLSRLPDSPEINARLRELLETGANEVVRQDAFESLLHLTNDEQLANRGLGMDSYNDEFRITSLQWLGQNRPDQARTHALAALTTGQVTEPFRLEAISVLGHVKDKAGERTVYDLLASYLQERSNSPLRAAIRAIGDYGDKSAIPLLKTRENHSLSFVRDDVRAALQRLGSG